MKIEKGIPIPSIQAEGLTVLLKQMEIGDSIFVPGKTTTGISSTLANVRAKNNFRFTSRTVDGGIRVWRTA